MTKTYIKLDSKTQMRNMDANGLRGIRRSRLKLAGIQEYGHDKVAFKRFNCGCSGQGCCWLAEKNHKDPYRCSLQKEHSFSVFALS
jgi:hypothetical protein